MVIMFNLNQAALLSIQLLVVCHVFAGDNPVEQRNLRVSRGDSVNFICNRSEETITQIIWTRDRFVFVYSSYNETFSNFTSQRLRIDKNLPSQMNIYNVQHEDAGLYKCILTDRKGGKTIEWNLTVSEKPEDISPLRYVLYILPAVVGFLLFGIPSAVCLYRKLSAMTTYQNPVQDQFEVQSTAEVTLPQRPSGTDSRTNNKHRSQYSERLNSIYGL